MSDAMSENNAMERELNTCRVRKFESGATRDTDENKLDFEGFLSYRVLKRYAEYMNKNRRLKDGSLRASDNWQAGIPLDAYMKSLWRHFMDVWSYHRGIWPEVDLYQVDLTSEQVELVEDAFCAVIFNASGYLHELLKNK